MCYAYTHSYRMMIYAEHLTQLETHVVTGFVVCDCLWVYEGVFCMRGHSLELLAGRPPRTAGL